MAEKLPEAAAPVQQMPNSDSAARLSSEAKASLQKEQRSLTMNRLTLNFQSRGAMRASRPQLIMEYVIVKRESHALHGGHLLVRMSPVPKS